MPSPPSASPSPSTATATLTPASASPANPSSSRAPPTQATSTKPKIRDVVDADTLLLDIDLGFEVIRRQRIRLARIDAPARDTAKGARGRRYVREQLAVARTLVVNTHKSDLHGRYVAHIFYAFNNQGIDNTFLNGRYLNQELIDKGFAKML